MKKVFNFIFIFLLTIILFASNKVYAAEYDYVYCEYDIRSNDMCHLKFSVTYVGDGSPLEYKTLESDGNYNNNLYEGKCTYDYKHFGKEAFTKDGALKCPTIYERSSFKSTDNTSNGREGLDYTYEYSTSKGSNYTKEYTMFKETVKKGTNSSEDLPNSFSYQYSEACGGFNLRIINGKIQLNQNPDSKYNIQGQENIDVKNYENENLCPKIYYQQIDGETTCLINDEELSGFKTDATCTKIDENTGSEFQGSTGPDLNSSLPVIENCTALLGNPDKAGSPAYYLVKAFDVVKYVAIVLLMVLSVMDFIGAVAKQDKDALSKILKRVMMRFILCIIIFFLPYFIKLLLYYLVERQTDLCGIGG